jgi:hypothetical protein
MVHFGGSFGTNVKRPRMGLEKRTWGDLGAEEGCSIRTSRVI